MVLLTRKLETSMSLKGSKSGISVHDWAQVNNWRSRPSTQASARLTVSVLSPRQDTGNQAQPQLGLRRCQTTLERPYKNKPVKQKSDSCTLDYIQYLRQRNKESEAKLKNTINVLGIQRSKSDLDAHEMSGFGQGNLFGEGLFKERTQLYVTTTPTEQLRRESTSLGNKQEMRLGVAGVPKKGLIHLSTNDGDTHMPMDDFQIHGERRRSSAVPEHGGSGSGKSKSLIKRRDILEQIKVGTRLLEDEEAQRLEEEQLTRSLGDYTILDLQSKILEMTDAKSVRRGTPVGQPDPLLASKKKEPTPKMEKSITLPAIKNINPFTMK